MAPGPKGDLENDRQESPPMRYTDSMIRTLAALFALAFSTATFADGAATFNQKCKVCHGPEGSGSKIVQRSIAGTPAAQVKKAVTEGFGKMKPVKIDDVTDVAAYVASLKKK
jgi:mono/diheme cytochrome c family protein